MTSQQRVALTSGILAAVAAFVIWLLLGDAVGTALVYALIVGVVAGAVSWFQQRPRA
jgi:hypothetical protein